MQLNLFNRDTVKLKPSSNNTRTCNKCGEIKDLQDFHVPYYKKNNEKGRSHTCKACIKKQNKDVSLLRKEHIPPQDSCCELCGVFSQHLHLDHDHANSSFRGYLCANCNQGLGKFKDDISKLKLAIEYLNRKDGL